MKKLQQYIVVDDDRTNNLICEYVIKDWDPQARVQLFLEPELALKNIEENHKDFGFPVLLFLDVNMPSMSGWEFLDIFKTFDDDIKKSFVIYILTSSTEDFSREAEEYPFVSGFLSKPLKKKYLENIELEMEAISE
ncbi:Response regulator receiver domain-containing protein [Salegentibacter holothuriorum]|uniref:Response regulator receiver domain-containing protein n=1 Tax=Salegentibacter holothuriorum TaxID=241145 RepID=A0A1T5C7R4_9FLAO|nr:response regulator [Salegentibacter holothuriorum]SKB55416.1 Response regulator receiver domain-containing protein [Salegentibacter holothuriorum]